MMKFRIPRLPLILLAVPAGVGLFTFWYAKGYSYLSNRPEVCVNCHVMQGQYKAWERSVHRDVSCNQCHLPQDGAVKYLAKMENGFRHSWVFTFETVQQIRIRPKNRDFLEANCRSCHDQMLTAMLPASRKAASCTHCHRRIGHRF
ncbi:MAG: cytochrome c nitrite reductase small subunit [Chrysiogenia bacterium]